MDTQEQTLMIGRTLGRYRIESKLGQGGMGTVYRARDLHLDRLVAIKVLPAAAMADPERKRRFVQEAKAASALNHPNIVTIYDIDNDQGVDFIAMEYVDGRTLHACIGSRSLELADSLRYAVQIADALAKAHAAGIVHRDLKPANIMITAPEGRTGLAKVLDFGVAKLTEPMEDYLASATESARFNERPRTEEGTILGTFSYMSPEQGEGKKVDARSDIFSFGTLLYEMVTSRRAFRGDSRLAVLFAVLREEPKPPGEIVDGLPQEVETIIARCLRKDPGRRFQVMDDVRIALEEVQEATATGELVQGLQSARPKRAKLWVYGLAILAVLAAIALGLRFRQAGVREPVRNPILTRLTSDPGLAGWPTLSPDGKLLTYASDRSGDGNLDIWLQQVAGGEPIRLTSHRADAREPAFSPDGTKIAFRSDREGGAIYVVSTLGGEARLIARHGRRPRFSPDGKWIAYWVRDENWAPSKSYVVASIGGQPRQLQPDFADAHYPIWAPDGKRILFCGTRDSTQPRLGHDWWVAPLETGTAVKTGAAEVFGRVGLSYSARDIPPGSIPNDPGDWVGDEIVFSARLGDSINLWRITISPQTWKVAGDPQRLTFGASMERHPSVSGGRVVFESGATNIDIWALPVDANRGKVLGDLQQLTRNAATYDAQPSISASGKKLAFTSNRSGNRDVWIKDLESGSEVALTNSPVVEGYPKISGDGSKVVYRVIEDPKQALYVLAASGGAPEKVCEDCGLPTHWSSDGRRILFEPGSRIARLVLFNVGSKQKIELLQQPMYGLHAARFSPDDRWIAYHADNGPFTRQIFIAAFHGETALGENEWIPVTDGAAMDHSPYWSPDGNLLYFLSERDGFRCIWAQRLQAATKRPAGPALPIRHFHTARHTLLMNVVASPWEVGLSVIRDKMLFSLDELAGNIWMAKLEGQK